VKRGVVGEVSMLRAVAHATRCSESWPGVDADNSNRAFQRGIPGVVGGEPDPRCTAGKSITAKESILRIRATPVGRAYREPRRSCHCIVSGMHWLRACSLPPPRLLRGHPGPRRAASRRVCTGSEHARRIPGAASDRRGVPKKLSTQHSALRTQDSGLRPDG
jgi:hypothetical protein